MAKDPAMLWYWGDWFSGTALMSRFLKGCYMDLLHAQFNSGRLSLEEIKICLGSDFGQAWPTLQKKFESENGLFFNERLEQEKEKRKNFCNSRGKNREKKSHEPSYENHMNNHINHDMENENENRNSVGSKGIVKGNLTDPLIEMEVGKCIEFTGITLHRKYDAKEMQGLWTAFSIQNEKTFYPNRNEKVKHFRNWIKTQPYASDKKSNGNNGSGSGEKLGTSSARLEALKKW